MARRALPVIPPEYIDEGLPKGIFSHSQYNSYKICPRSYEFKYVRKMNTPPSVAMFKGTVVHEGADRAHKYMIENNFQVPVLGEMLAVVSDKFDTDKEEVTDWGKDDDDKPVTPGSVKDLALKAYTVYHKQLPKLKPQASEKHFVSRIGTVPVQGYVDLIDHVQGPSQGGIPDPGHLLIRDLKTGATWSQSDVDKDVQLTLYHIVEGVPFVHVDNIKLLKGGPAYNDKLIPVQRTAIDRRNLVEDYEDVVDHIKKGDFPMAPIEHWSCTKKWCGYYDKCRGRAV